MKRTVNYLQFYFFVSFNNYPTPVSLFVVLKGGLQLLKHSLDIADLAH